MCQIQCNPTMLSTKLLTFKVMPGAMLLIPLHQTPRCQKSFPSFCTKPFFSRQFKKCLAKFFLKSLTHLDPTFLGQKHFSAKFWGLTDIYIESGMSLISLNQTQRCHRHCGVKLHIVTVIDENFKNVQKEKNTKYKMH